MLKLSSQMKARLRSYKKIIILTAVAFATAVCGFLLLLPISHEREYVANRQEAMMKDFLRDFHDGELPEENEETPALEETQGILEAMLIDGIFFMEEYNGIENDDTAHEPEPLYNPVYQPFPDNVIPDNITGIGILTIESIDLRLPIAEGVEETTLRIAPGWVSQTAQVGDIGNAVIAGHRDYKYGLMFNRLGELENGNVIQYQARNGEMMEFTVFEIAVIEPENQIAFLQPLNESIITLYTCTPVRVASHRLIIRARRIS